MTTLQEKQKYPLLIAVDEEGGYVTRVSRFKAFRDEKFASIFQWNRNQLKAFIELEGNENEEYKSSNKKKREDNEEDDD